MVQGYPTWRCQKTSWCGPEMRHCHFLPSQSWWQLGPAGPFSRGWNRRWGREYFQSCTSVYYVPILQIWKLSVSKRVTKATWSVTHRTRFRDSKVWLFSFRHKSLIVGKSPSLCLRICIYFCLNMYFLAHRWWGETVVRWFLKIEIKQGKIFILGSNSKCEA